MNLEFDIGLALAAVGLVLAAWHWVRRQRMTRTRGSIVRVEASQSEKGASSPVKPVKLTIRFTDDKGLVRFFTGQARGEDRKPGDGIGVLYLPSDPQKSMIEDMSIWVAPIVLAVIGLGLASMGFLKLSGLN